VAVGAGGADRLLDTSGAAPSGPPRRSVPSLPATPRLGLDVPTPRLLHDRGVSLFAPLRRPALARARPNPRAAVVARLAARTPERTSNLVLVIGRARDRGGMSWLRVRLPSLRHRTGWVPRSALGGYGAVHTRLIVDRHRLTAVLLRDRRPVFHARIGIGKPSTPTPGGLFYVRDRVTSYASPIYGPLAFGTSARSATLTDWPGGGFVGIHGTNRPDLLPGRVSHGCIRMRNADILRLGRLMPVGTPVTIR
jgi:hypothetical protein